MQDHLKHRLTGAAILVVVVVLLVPEMFRGRPGASADRVPGSLEGPPIRSYTIDLREGGVTKSPTAATATSSSAAPAGSAFTLTTPVPASTPPASGHDSGAEPGSPAESPTALPSARAAPAPAAAAGPTPAAAPAAATAPRHTASPRAGWTVQVATFTRRDLAEHLVKQLRARGFAVEAAGPDEHGRYRVRTAAVADRAAALATRQRMIARGLKPVVNRTP